MDKQQVMSPTDPPATHAANTDTNAAEPTITRVSAGARDGAVSPRKSESGASEHESDRMDRLEGRIGILIRDLARERKDWTKQPIATSNVHMASAGSVFSQFLAAKNGRARADSVEEAIGIAPENPARPFMAPPQQNRAPEQFFPPMQEPAAGR